MLFTFQQTNILPSFQSIFIVDSRWIAVICDDFIFVFFFFRGCICVSNRFSHTLIFYRYSPLNISHCFLHFWWQCEEIASFSRITVSRNRFEFEHQLGLDYLQTHLFFEIESTLFRNFQTWYFFSKIEMKMSPK